MPQWDRTNSGILVPQGYALAKAFEDTKRDKVQRGRFFSTTSLMTGNAGPGYTKPADTLPFEMLRQSRDKSLIDKIIIMARITQMKWVARRIIVPGKQVGFRVVHENYADPNYKPDEGTIRRCKEMERIIENVNQEIHPGGFRDFAAISVDQELTYDRKAMVITRDRTGAPIRYHLVDGTTVRSVLQVLLEYMDKHNIDRKNKDAGLHGYYKDTGVDLTNAAFVQVVDGMPVAAWTADEMSIDITNPSVEINRWAYGAGSALEQSIAASISFMQAWAYNDGLFNQDSPESLLFLYGDYDPVGLGAFQRQILDQSGSGDYQKIPVIPADPEFKAELVKIRELPKDIQFPELMRIMIQLKTASYRAHPSIVNFSIDQGSGSGLSIGNNSEDEIVQHAHEEGFETLCYNMSTWITRTIIKPRYDDLVMIMETDTENEQKRVELIAKQQKSNMTFNEGRRAQGFTGDLPFGDVPDNANYIEWAKTMMEMKQQEAMMTQGGQAQGAQNSTKPEQKQTKPGAVKPDNDKELKKPVDSEDKKERGNGRDGHGNIQDPEKVAGNDESGPQRVRKSLEKGEEKVLVFEFIG